MELSDLRIFRAVVSEGGVTRAAEALHRVQSNVTTRVRQLEEDLGVALFVREGKRMRLAPGGEVLLDYADRMLALAEEAREAVQDPRPRGVFRLGAMESTAAVRLPALIGGYCDRHPEVALEMRDGNPQQLARAVLAGDLDAAFVAEPIDDAPFDKAPAFVERLAIVSARRVEALGRDDSPRLSILGFEPGCPYRKRLEDWFADQGRLPARTIEMSSYHAMLGCVVAGMGVSLLPRSVLRTFPDRERVRVHDLPPGKDRAETVLIWRKGAGSPKIAAMAELLRAASEKNPAQACH